jgi:hypothetical protein
MDCLYAVGVTGKTLLLSLSEPTTTLYVLFHSLAFSFLAAYDLLTETHTGMRSWELKAGRSLICSYVDIQIYFKQLLDCARCVHNRSFDPEALLDMYACAHTHMCVCVCIHFCNSTKEKSCRFLRQSMLKPVQDCTVCFALCFCAHHVSEKRRVIFALHTSVVSSYSYLRAFSKISRMKRKEAMTASLCHTHVDLWHFSHFLCIYMRRYLHIPIANLCGAIQDDIITVSDVLFARLLKTNNHILWASPGGGMPIFNVHALCTCIIVRFDMIFLAFCL